MENSGVVHPFVEVDDPGSDDARQKARFITDGDVMEFPLNHHSALICCDCGLAHRYEFEVDLERDVVIFKPVRDEELTELFRDDNPDKFPLWQELKSLFSAKN